MISDTTATRSRRTFESEVSVPTRSAVVPFALAALPLLLAASARQDPTPERTDALLPLVEQYFRTEPEEDRRQLADRIEDTAADIDEVARALRRVRLWSDIPTPRGRIALRAGSGVETDIAFRLPDGYTPDRAWPAVISMPHNGTNAEDTLTSMETLLGESVARFVLVALDKPVGGSFYRAPSDTTRLPTLLRQLRQRIRLDTDRVLLFGRNEGADAAWIAALMHTDEFAGLISLNGYPPIPYAAEVYPLLLDNLQHLPVVHLWDAVRPNVQISERTAAVFFHNRAMAAIAEERDLPLTGYEVEPSVLNKSPLPASVLEPILAARRPPPAANIVHWFRYPHQGHAGWVIRTRTLGDIWLAQQLAILPASHVDHDTFIRSVLRARLGYLSRHIDRQLVRIETEKCARIEVLIPHNLFPADRAVSISINGIVRHAGPITPDVHTLLETAWQQWEFTRLCVARHAFNIARDREARSPVPD